MCIKGMLACNLHDSFYFNQQVSIASVIGEFTNTGGNLNSLRSLRTLRALRPLRAVSRWDGMKVLHVPFAAIIRN